MHYIEVSLYCSVLHNSFLKLTFTKSSYQNVSTGSVNILLTTQNKLNFFQLSQVRVIEGVCAIRP